MKQHSELRPSLRKLLRDEGGAILIMTTVYLPVIVGFFTMAVDMSYVLRVRGALQVAAESGALAATANLPFAGPACTAAQTYAGKNMPNNATNGNILKTCNDVILGNWPTGCTTNLSKTDGGCFTPVTDCIASIGQCNAAKVTTRMTKANGNALGLNFAPMIGIRTFDVTATAIAIFGGTGVPWNAIIVQDVSPSFSDELKAGTAQTADQTLLDCMKQFSASGSTLGIDPFATPSLAYQAPLAVNGTTSTTTTTTKLDTTHFPPKLVTTTTTTTTNNNDTLAASITGLAGCGSNNMPACNVGNAPGGDTNIGGAIDSAVLMACPSGTCPAATVATQALVIVTDGQPNRCGPNACQNGLTPQTYAEAEATKAGNLGIDIYTICYGCSTTDSNFLAKLVKGNGIAMTAPTIADIKTQMAKACASGLRHRLVW